MVLNSHIVVPSHYTVTVWSPRLLTQREGQGEREREREGERERERERERVCVRERV